MRGNVMRVIQLTAAIRKQGPTDDLMKQVIVTLADEVIHLSRELETVRSMAQRAERQSRLTGAARMLVHRPINR